MRTYGYDKVGNRTSKRETTPSGTESIAYSYDLNDRLTLETKTTALGSQVVTGYTWDANGNLKTKSSGGSVTVYLWNGDNHLIEVKQGSSEATATTLAKYAYDAGGNRTQKIEPGQSGQPDKVTSYLVDSTFPYAQTVQENVTDGTGTTATNYVWGASLIEQIRGGQGTFYHGDGLGSIKLLTDATGTTTDSYEYDAFGTVESRTGATANAYGYTGEYFDSSAGLQYNRARWYDAAVGRFTGIDPFAGSPNKPITLNKYAYAESDPADKIDPSGSIASLGEAGAAEAGSGILGGISLPSFTGAFTRIAAQLLRVGARSLPIIRIVARTCALNPTSSDCRGIYQRFS